MEIVRSPCDVREESLRFLTEPLRSHYDSRAMHGSPKRKKKNKQKKKKQAVILKPNHIHQSCTAITWRPHDKHAALWYVHIMTARYPCDAWLPQKEKKKQTKKKKQAVILKPNHIHQSCTAITWRPHDKHAALWYVHIMTARYPCDCNNLAIRTHRCRTITLKVYDYFTILVPKLS